MPECINRYCPGATESHQKPKSEVKHVSCPLLDRNDHLQVLTCDNWRRSVSITSLMPIENRRELMPDHGYRPTHLDRSDMKHNPSWYTARSTLVQRPNWVVAMMGDQDVRTWFKRSSRSQYNRHNACSQGNGLLPLLNIILRNECSSKPT